jgi:hypothetical protein
MIIINNNKLVCGTFPNKESWIDRKYLHSADKASF